MRYLAAAVLALMVMASTQPCKADWADHDKYPTDKETNKCLDQNPSTGGQCGCWDEAYKKWDEDLNRQYRALVGRLAPAEKKQLQEAEVEWMKFRDQELKLIDDVYAHTSGSMYAPAQAASKVRIVRDRAILLKHYCDLVNGK
jgi:uncharacterized protein YecT (DUF1311 family)